MLSKLTDLSCLVDCLYNFTAVRNDSHVVAFHDQFVNLDATVVINLHVDSIQCVATSRQLRDDQRHASPVPQYLTTGSDHPPR